jgi:hypothetical protein
MARRVQCAVEVFAAGIIRVSSAGRRTMQIAQAIELYVSEHPRAADTAEGVRSWWIGATCDSLEDVQQALDHLVASHRLTFTVLPDGAALYSRVSQPSRGDIH